MTVKHYNAFLGVYENESAQEIFVTYHMGLVATKPVFGASDKERLKPASSAKEILLVASLHMILSKKRLKVALISLYECTGWSAPLLFANPEDGFSGV